MASSSLSHLFQPKDFDTVQDKIKDIIAAAKRAENEKIEPTLAQKRAMANELLEFIQKKGRIIYGGYAVNELIRVKRPEEAFYDFSTEAPDIEFYSPDAVMDAKELCDLFHSKGYKYIRSTEALHAETYKVMVNLHPLCDITYVPKNIHRAIPYVELDRVKYAHPHFLLIDSLRIITDPLTSYWRLDKAFPRIYGLQKHYPLVKPRDHDKIMASLFRVSQDDIDKKHVDQGIQVILNTARKDLDGAKGELAIIVGCAALRSYAAWISTNEDSTGIPFIELVLTEYAGSITKIYQALEAAFGAENVQYEEYQRFFDYCGRRGHIYVHGKLVARLFHHNNRCTPVLPLSLKFDVATSETLRLATLSVTALYLMVVKLISQASASSREEVAADVAACDALLFDLYDMRSRYMSIKDQDFSGEHPFLDFTSTCVGHSVAALRAHKEETEYRKTHPHLFGMAYFVYEPSVQPKFNIADYKYMNSSGNIVRTERDQLFSPSGLAPNSQGPDSAALEGQQDHSVQGAQRRPRSNNKRRGGNNRGRRGQGPGHGNRSRSRSK